jgi:hypothetical protein
MSMSNHSQLPAEHESGKLRVHNSDNQGGAIEVLDFGPSEEGNKDQTLFEEIQINNSNQKVPDRSFISHTNFSDLDLYQATRLFSPMQQSEHPEQIKLCQILFLLEPLFFSSQKSNSLSPSDKEFITEFKKNCAKFSDKISHIKLNKVILKQANNNEYLLVKAHNLLQADIFQNQKTTESESVESLKKMARLQVTLIAVNS